MPLVPVDEGCEQCCDGILTAKAAEMPWWQRIPFGTTAWRMSMGRRQVVESVNAALKGTFADLGRGFFRVIGQTKMTVLLGFTVAGYNLDRIRSFRAKHHLDENGQPTEKPSRPEPSRRTGTWADIIEPTGSAARHNRAPNPRPSRLPTAAGFNASRSTGCRRHERPDANDGPRKGRRDAVIRHE